MDDLQDKLKDMGITPELMAELELHANLPVVKELKRLNKNLEALVAKEHPMMEMPMPPEVQKMELMGAEKVIIEGKPGKIPEKGVDYYTPEEIAEIKKEVTPKKGIDYDDGKPGYTPKKNVDYFDGEPGETPRVDYETIIGETTKKVNETLTPLVPKKDDLISEILEKGDKIIESINSDESENVIKREKVEGLNDELLAIRNLPRGGGVSALGVRQAFKYIFHTEEPTGVINGSNVTYTVANPIWAIIGFTLNGEQIAELPNYTFANRTITFSSALPATYSGKDFEIKYIG